MAKIFLILGVLFLVTLSMVSSNPSEFPALKFARGLSSLELNKPVKDDGDASKCQCYCEHDVTAVIPDEQDSGYIDCPSSCSGDAGCMCGDTVYGYAWDGSCEVDDTCTCHCFIANGSFDGKGVCARDPVTGKPKSCTCDNSYGYNLHFLVGQCEAIPQ